MNRIPSDRAYVPAVNGLVLLVFGFFFAINVFTNHGPFYVFSIHAYNWTLRVGGLLLLAAAGLCAAGRRLGPLLHSVFSLTAGVILFACVVTWFAFERGFDLINILSLLIAGSLIRSGCAGWMLWRAAAADVADRAQRVQIDEISVVKISSSVLPSADEPPPPEGYLAALAKEHRDQRMANRDQRKANLDQRKAE
ncbi:MAG: hypothetical protein KF841_12680 [Phycisphaerae bacterium]|nr:hypothetical protein [Phycisphaerae bacterium]